jgi:uncharacterized protein YciI
MKAIISVLLLTTLIVFTQNISAQTTDNYDSALAKKLQADDYGMKSYVLVILKKGTANITDKKILDSIFHGHMANIQRLADENKLVLAGPMGDNDKNYEGIFIFNTADIHEAKQWLSTDPAIQSNDLDAELYVWYCTAALQEIPSLHKQIQKKSF